MAKRYKAVAKIEMNGKQGEVVISNNIRSYERGIKLMNEFKKNYKGTNVKVIETNICQLY